MKKITTILIFFISTALLIGQTETIPENDSTFKILDSLIGGFIGGILGVFGALLSSYFGPKEFEKWKLKQKEIKQDGPRKKLLMKLLEDKRFHDGRRLTTLSRCSGTNLDECRRLLIEIEARGLTLKDEYGNEIEGWAFIKNKPLDEA